MGNFNAVKANGNATIAINWINKNDKNDKPEILPYRENPGVFDESGNINKENLGKPVTCIEMPGGKYVTNEENIFPNLHSYTVIGNEKDISDLWNKLQPKSIDDQIKEKEKELDELKKKRDAEDANAQKIIDKIKDLIGKGGDPSTILEKIKELNITFPWLQISKKPGWELPEGAPKIKFPTMPSSELPEGTPDVKFPTMPSNELPEGTPDVKFPTMPGEKIDPGFEIEPPKSEELKPLDAIDGKIATQKAPEKRAKNGLNLADAYKIMDYIHNKHRVKSKDGSSYIDLRNLSPAEQNLYNQAVSAANELNPRSMVYDISGLDTSKADELIKKFEQENS